MDGNDGKSIRTMLRKEGLISAVKEAGADGYRKLVEAPCVACGECQEVVIRWDGKKLTMAADHHCDEARLRKIEGARKAAGTRRPYEPPECQRLSEGLEMLGRD